MKDHFNEKDAKVEPEEWVAIISYSLAIITLQNAMMSIFIGLLCMLVFKLILERFIKKGWY